MVTLPSQDFCIQCGVCVETCPKHAISMTATGGIPVIDSAKCIECGLCGKLCPVMCSDDNKSARHDKAVAFACHALSDPVRTASASGGAFAVLARYCLSQGWLVCGAAYHPFPKVRHILISTVDELPEIVNSKYVYSELGPVLKDFKAALINGRKILFGGLPCQVAALRSFLGPLAGGVVFCDLICHGTPPSDLFTRYIEYLSWRFPGTEIKNFIFRPDKQKYFWGDFSNASFDGEHHLGMADLWYLRYFLQGNIFRSCCYSCQWARLPRIGDLTLGDCWQLGSDPGYSRTELKLGWSLVLCNTKAGTTLFDQIRSSLVCRETSMDESIRNNRQLVTPSCPPKKVGKEGALRFTKGLIVMPFRWLFIKESIRCSGVLLYRLVMHGGGMILRILRLKGPRV